MCVNWKIQVQVLTAVRERRGLSVILYVKQPFVNLILDDAERKDVYLWARPGQSLVGEDAPNSC